MTEQQPYDVLEQRDGFELRHYPAHVVAEVEVEGSFEDAGNRAFRVVVPVHHRQQPVAGSRWR